MPLILGSPIYFFVLKNPYLLRLFDFPYRFFGKKRMCHYKGSRPVTQIFPVLCIYFSFYDK